MMQKSILRSTRYNLKTKIFNKTCKMLSLFMIKSNEYQAKLSQSPQVTGPHIVIWINTRTKMVLAIELLYENIYKRSYRNIIGYLPSAKIFMHINVPQLARTLQQNNLNKRCKAGHIINLSKWRPIQANFQQLGHHPRGTNATITNKGGPPEKNHNQPWKHRLRRRAGQGRIWNRPNGNNRRKKNRPDLEEEYNSKDNSEGDEELQVMIGLTPEQEEMHGEKDND